MTGTQIDSIFNTLDTDKSGEVSDSEWTAFFEEFLEKYQACDADSDGKLNAGEITACLTSETSGLKVLSSISAKAADIIRYMDRKTDLTLYDYMFLRRVASAMKNCAD